MWQFPKGGNIMTEDFHYTLQKQLNDIVEMKKDKFIYEGDFFNVEQHVALMKEDLQSIMTSAYTSKEMENLRGYIRTTYSDLLKKLKQLFIDKKNKEMNKLWDDYGVALFTSPVSKEKYPSVVMLKVEGVLIPIN